MSEHTEQAALFEWAQYMINQGRMPELAWMYANPNWRPKESERIYLAAEGMKPGIPDICLPIPRNGKHGLYIELKTKTGRASKGQKQWIEGLAALGYEAQVCKGWEAARDVILDYLEYDNAKPTKEFPNG